jgi:hydrogenase maturation protein HypF
VLDAIACYFNICTKRTYDGEPAMKLEKYLAIGKPVHSFDIEVKNNVIGTIDLFRQVDEKIDKPLSEKEKADYAHSMVKAIIDSLSKIAIENAKNKGIDNIGLTGGVSYNIPITDMVNNIVTKTGLKLTVHNRIPNGDGGISIGQNAIIGHKLNNV